MVEAIPPAYPPGTDWAYSNLGYVTLGILIHRVSGQYFGGLSAGAGIQAARHVDDSHHKRSGHHSESSGGLST
jgi:Beta-lactamase